MRHVPCGTRDSSANRARWIKEVPDGYALIINKGGHLEMIPSKSLEILRLALPDLKIVHE